MAEIKLTINGKECTAPAGSTILQAAERNGIHIPKLCYLEGIHQYGACRICVVEQINPPAKNLQASCMVEARMWYVRWRRSKATGTSGQRRLLMSCVRLWAA